MKRTTAIGIILLCSSIGLSQSYSDDFESYSPGDYMGVVSSNWTTWSGATGGAEDVQVTTANANSGSNALFFSSIAANGGPQDVLLLFGGQYNTGQFNIEMSILVETNKNAYFNFQGTTTAGQIWSMNANFENGVMTLDDATSIMTTASYPINTWFKLKLEINLSTNDWEVFVDDISQGTFQNDVNQIASCDLYPVNGSSFYIDDVSYVYTPYTLPSVNGAAISIDMNGLLAGQVVQPTARVRNLGTTTINSYDVSITYNGNTITENVTGVSIASLANDDVDFANSLTLVSGLNNAVLTISNVNGSGSDDDSGDDSKPVAVDPIVPAAGKLVIGEEATGTWCGWCPRGAVGLADMKEKYDGFFQGIAVHNGDPMVVSTYDAGIGGLISGYPSGLVDRVGDIDPSVFEGDFLQRISIPPVAFLSNTATYDAGTNDLEITVSADFQQNISGDYRIAVVIIEDDVTGTGSGYNQVNYYSFQSQNLPLIGDGHNWQLEPNPVPASDMIYQHVARAIDPSFSGLAGSFPGSVSAGAVHDNVFNITLDPSWTISKLTIVSLLIAPNGQIDNAASTTVMDAVSTEDLVKELEVNLYPNPTNQTSFLKLTLKEPTPVLVTITDLSGRTVATRQYGTLSDTQILPIYTAGFSSGIYTVTIQAENQLKAMKLIVE